MRRFYFYSLVGLAGFGFGQGAIVMWPEWSAWTWWGLATATLVIGLPLPTILDNRQRIFAWMFADRPSPKSSLTRSVETSNNDGAAGGIVLILILSAVVGGYVWGVFSRDPIVWTHPAMPQQEQVRVASECEMEALKVRRGDRYMYERACLISRGFVQEIDAKEGADQ